MADYNSCGAATLLNNIDATCDQSIGGIKRILIAQRADVKTVSVGDDGIIDTITMETAKKFVQWLFRRNTGSYTSTVTTDDTIGNSSATTEVQLQFSKAEAQKRMEIQAAINAAAVVIIEDMYGQFIYLGMDNPVYITNAVMQSGTAKADLSGFTLTFTAEDNELPHFVDSKIIDGLLTDAA